MLKIVWVRFAHTATGEITLLRAQNEHQCMAGPFLATMVIQSHGVCCVTSAVHWQFDSTEWQSVVWQKAFGGTPSGCTSRMCSTTKLCGSWLPHCLECCCCCCCWNHYIVPNTNRAHLATTGYVAPSPNHVQYNVPRIRIYQAMNSPNTVLSVCGGHRHATNEAVFAVSQYFVGWQFLRSWKVLTCVSKCASVN